MSLSAKHALLGSALLLAALPLCANEPASGSGVAPAPRAFVKCPGIDSVPMTSDAAQALPLSEVASLSCGQAVVVLADDEGYTAFIRTGEGQEGYVARMYLSAAAPPSASRPAAAPVQIVNATPKNGVVRWRAGAPGFEAFQSEGRLIESATANGITVQVSLQDTGWKYLATVAISNQSGSSVYVLPALITLDELKPSLRNLRAQNPAKLAHNEVNHQLFRSEVSAQPPQGARHAVVASGSSVAVASVAFRTTSSHPMFASDYDDASVQAVALKDVNLAAAQKTAGALWFARDSNARELSMRLSVGNLVFDFPFSFPQSK
ncbi:MAG TPA: hypothetical protein VL128_14090 [Candidatus Eisenbacteria bacterium]|nr:hypothetical protein [Candidatus Eisenbacteria bacterium]